VNAPNLQRYYTPWQVCVGTIIAGPLAGGYFAYRDHQLFGNQKKASATLLVSGVVLIGLLGLSALLRKGDSTVVLTCLVASIYRLYAAGAFDSEISRRRISGWTSESWWRVFGISISILVGILLCGSILLLALAKL
jgi:hypothetical protein